MVDYIQADVFTSVEGWLVLLVLVILLFLETSTLYFVVFVAFNSTIRMQIVDQRVTKRCRLFWLTNSALVYMSPNAANAGDGGGGGGVCGVSVNEYSYAHEAQINWEI